MLRDLDLGYFETMMAGLAGPVLMATVVPWVLLVYFIFRYRAAQEGQQDPHIGAKTVLHIFGSIGVLMLLAAVTGLTVENLLDDPPNRRDSGPSAVTRACLALIVSGAIILGCAIAALRNATNDIAYPMVGRLFTGLRFALSALISLTALTILLQIWFAEGDAGESGRVTIGVLIVWLASALVHFHLLVTAMNTANEPEARQG